MSEFLDLLSSFKTNNYVDRQLKADHVEIDKTNGTPIQKHKSKTIFLFKTKQLEFEFDKTTQAHGQL